MTGSRVLVQESVADGYRRRLSELVEAVKVGLADREDSQMGPLVDAANVERVERFIAEASKYATVLVKGGRPSQPELANGAFFRPAMLESKDVNVPLVQEEIFAPVLSFETFSEEADAIAKANATIYGLAAAVFTKDIDRAARVVRKLKAGTVWTNAWAVLSDAVEEGGYKGSGIGRARGARAAEEFQEIKTHFLAYKT
jgi:betaine-aldehyde dehydrogenase